MKLLRLAPNAHTLETHAGAVLFSYELPAAVRLDGSHWRPPGPFTNATRAHMARFTGSPVLPVEAINAQTWAAMVQEALSDPRP